MSKPTVDAASPAVSSDVVDLAQIGSALKRNVRWIVGPAILAAAAATAYVTVATPRYSGEAKILLESRESSYTRPLQDRDGQSQQIDEQGVASQVLVISSRDIARQAIQRLGLVGNPEFDPLVGPIDPLTRLKILFGGKNGEFDGPPEDRIFKAYYDRLVVYPVNKSRVVSVEFQSRDPELAARGSNLVTELYLDTLEAAKKDTARSASAWLGGTIDSLRERVTTAEAKVEEFRARSGLLVGTNNATITSQQLAELSTQVANARTARADSEAKASLIRDLIRSGRTFEIPDVANNDLIRRLIEQRVGLRAQLASELRTLLPGHPRIKQLEAQVGDLEAQIRGAAERTVRTLENEARIAGSRAASLEAALDAQKKVAAQANENEVDLRALEREAKAQRDQLETYLARYRDASARDSANATPPDARIVSRAIVPQLPVFPKKGPIILLTTLAALVLACGIIVARELLTGGGERAVETAEPVADAVPEMPVADAMPLKTSVTDAPQVAPAAADLEEAGFAPSYDFDALIARLARTEPEDRGRRILVLGHAGDAATTDGDGDEGGNAARRGDADDLARGLGAVLARHGRAILITVNGLGDAPLDLGFTDLVAGEASFFEVIGRAPGSRLHMVGAGTLDGALLADEWEGLDIALTAFDETYPWAIYLVNDSSDRAIVHLLAQRCDCVVIASEDAPDSERLVDLYEAAKAAGAPDVVVACRRIAADSLAA